MVKPDITLSEITKQDDYLGIKGIHILPKTTLIESLAKCMHHTLGMSEAKTKQYLYDILADHVTLSMFDILKTMYHSIQEKLDSNKEQHKLTKSQLSSSKKEFKQLQQKDDTFQTLVEELKTLKQKSQHHLTKHKYLQN